MDETSTPIKVGIAGMGRAGMGMHTNELKKYEDRFQVVAGCDIDTSRLPVLREKYPDCETYTSLDEILKEGLKVVKVSSQVKKGTEFEG